MMQHVDIHVTSLVGEQHNAVVSAQERKHWVMAPGKELTEKESIKVHKFHIRGPHFTHDQFVKT